MQSMGEQLHSSQAIGWPRYGRRYSYRRLGKWKKGLARRRRWTRCAQKGAKARVRYV